MRWICSSSRHSSTTPARMPLTSRRCRGTSRASVRPIDNLVTGNDVRARLVVHEWRAPGIRCGSHSRAIVFCVSVAHAEFMTDWLNRAGSTGRLRGRVRRAPDERRRAPQRLGQWRALCAGDGRSLQRGRRPAHGRHACCSCDPRRARCYSSSRSARGLRLAAGKESCLVLDFVGQHRTEFRFDRLLVEPDRPVAPANWSTLLRTASAACRPVATSTCSARRENRCCKVCDP